MEFLTALGRRERKSCRQRPAARIYARNGNLRRDGNRSVAGGENRHPNGLFWVDRENPGSLIERIGAPPGVRISTIQNKTTNSYVIDILI
jgi:hypothetical protein